MSRTLIPRSGNDKIYTPDDLAYRIVKHFNPSGSVLEPCAGKGSFLRAFQKHKIWGVGRCEIDEGLDFFKAEGEFDYIVSNFPWSQSRKFVQHSMKLAKNVIYLTTLNHVIGLKARLRDIREAGFGIKEICLTDTPKEFPQSGFQLGIVHLSKDWKGPTIFSELEKSS